MSFDKFGDKLKAQEQIEAGRKADKTKPLMCRLDGKSFHTFTKGLARPYDVRLSQLMIDTAKYLVKQTHAKLAYVQSDEISLYWHLDLEASPSSQFMYDGKFQKLSSILAGMASAYFNKELASRIPEKADCLPVFDARVWNVNSIEEVSQNFEWRVQDCIKNSISMAAQAVFSPKWLHEKNSEDKKRMLFEAGKPWEVMPNFFRVGTFVKRKVVMVELTEDQLLAIPEKFRPIGIVERSEVEAIEFNGVIEL